MHMRRACAAASERMASQIVGDGASLEWQSCICGHHAYCMLWTPVVGELLTLRREPENLFDCHAVAVMKNDLLVGHIPRSLCRVVFYFLGKDGYSAVCEVTGSRVNHGVQPGLEVPCTYRRFYGRQLYIDRLKDLLVDVS